jgi:aryl-alcohol dehydrogenase-like predicted oxidoreductase
MDAANAYAASRGLVGFTALSNQFSLARMVVPTFPGCLGASGPEWASWLTGAGIPVVAWSSQAAGFFAGVDAKAWASADNVERRARAGALGARLGVEATTIALAWVLTQPLPVFPIIGPRNLVELRSSLAALSVRLSAKDVAWLDLQ